MVKAGRGDAVLDAGCGDGYYAGMLARETECDAHGIDISIPAIEAAARRYPQFEWVVANADRFVPYTDASFSVVLSITARMNAAEFRRVMRDDARLLVAVPGPEDLIEVRGAGRDRGARTVEEFAGDFHLIEQKRVTSTLQLDETAVNDVLLAIYRPVHAKPVTAMQLTFSLDLMLFTPRPPRTAREDMVSKNRKECSTYEHTKDQDQSKTESTTENRTARIEETKSDAVSGESRAGTSRDQADAINFV